MTRSRGWPHSKIPKQLLLGAAFIQNLTTLKYIVPPQDSKTIVFIFPCYWCARLSPSTTRPFWKRFDHSWTIILFKANSNKTNVQHFQNLALFYFFPNARKIFSAAVNELWTEAREIQKNSFFLNTPYIFCWANIHYMTATKNIPTKRKSVNVLKMILLI